MAANPDLSMLLSLTARVRAWRSVRFYGCYVQQERQSAQQTQHEPQSFHPAGTSHNAPPPFVINSGKVYHPLSKSCKQLWG